MEKWDLQPAPSSHDKDRHLLRIKGGMKDVFLVVKKLGAHCGRPLKLNGREGYDFSLHVHDLNAPAKDHFIVFLERMVAPAVAAAPAPDSAAAAEIEPEPPVPEDISPLAAPPVPAENGPEQAQAKTSGPSDQELKRIFAAQKGREESPAPAAEVPPASQPSPGKPAAPLSAVKPLWGLKAGAAPACSMETLVVGPFNRFAHAAVTAVIGSPGAIYNPLFLYGSPSTGKTRMIHSIAAALTASLGEDAVIMTQGSRLSWAAEKAVEEGRQEELKKAAAAAKALLVDDVHLTFVTERNKALLEQFFKTFFSRGLQVAAASIYPPRSLKAMEEALRVPFSEGWAVDLKIPSPSAQTEMARAYFSRNGVILGDQGLEEFVKGVSGSRGEPRVWLRRLAVLCGGGREAAPVQGEDRLAALFRSGVGEPAGSGFPEEEKNVPSVPEGSPLAVVVPEGMEGSAPWFFSRFCEAGGRLNPGMGIGAFWRSEPHRRCATVGYDVKEPYGVPFRIGQACRAAGAAKALLFGPSPDSPLAANTAEFIHAVERVLDGLDVGFACILGGEPIVWADFIRARLDLTGGRLD